MLRTHRNRSLLTELKYLIMRNNYKQVAPNGASKPCLCPKSPVRGALIVENKKQSETKAPSERPITRACICTEVIFFVLRNIS
jgi:hypothetical protein